jgi:Protein of unknown function (DUF3568)
MKKRFQLFSLGFAALLAVTSLVQTGCVVVAAGAAGAGAVAYVRGELQSTLTGSFEAVEKAANRSIEQLQLVKINEKKDAFVAIITARTADDKKVEIKATKLAAETTKVEIRVGVFGDEAKSLAILEKIKANL